MKKTLRSRIAAVAVAALGVGMLQASPAFAASPAATDADAAVSNVSGLVSGPIPALSVGADTSYFTILTGGSFKVTLTNGGDKKVKITTSSAGIITASTGSTAGAVIADDGSSLISGADDDNALVATIAPTGAVGSAITVKTYWDSSGTYTLRDTLVFYIGSRATALVASAADSYINLAASATTATGTDAAGAASAANGGKIYINYDLYDAYGFSAPGLVTASVDGGAVVAVNANGTNTVGTATVGFRADASSGTIVVSQGTANVAAKSTVTITLNGSAWVVKTTLITGKLAKIVAAPVADVISGNGGASASAVYFLGYDAADNRIAIVDVSKYSATGSLVNATIATTASTATAAGLVDITTNSNDGYGAGTITFYSGTAVSNAVSLTSASTSKASFTATFDKASYKVGDVATLTITAKDSGSRLVSDYATLGTGALITVPGTSSIDTCTTTTTFSNGVVKCRYSVTTVGSFTALVQLTLAGVPTTVTAPLVVAAPTPVADPTVTALTTAVQQMLSAVQTQMTAMTTSIQLLVSSFSTTVAKLIAQLSKKK